MKKVFANCFVRFGILLLFAMASRGVFAASSDDNDDKLSFCNFGPRVNVVEPEAKVGSDPCAAKVHVQGVLWKCGNPNSVSDTVSHFFTQLTDRAREECTKFCEKLGDNCRAIYSPKYECGLKTSHEEAVSLGKELGCRNDCTDGKAFTYCSIYDTGYQGPSPARVLSQPPNCECRSGS